MSQLDPPIAVITQLGPTRQQE